MIRTLFPLLFACAAGAAPDHLEEKARMEPFYGPYNLGVTAQLEGRIDDAAELFSRAAEGARNMRTGWWQGSMAYLALGGVYHARRDLAHAEECYLRGMDSFKYMKQDLGPAGLSGLGRIYLDRGQPAKAAPLLKEAREMEYAWQGRRGSLAALAAAISDLGRLYELQGSPVKAEVNYRTALKLLESTPVPPIPSGIGAEQMDAYPAILYRLGDLYRRAGRAEDADRRFRQALDAFPLWGGTEARPALKARKLEYRSYTLKALGRADEAAADLKEAKRLYRQLSAPGR